LAADLAELRRWIAAEWARVDPKPRAKFICTLTNNYKTARQEQVGMRANPIEKIRTGHINSLGRRPNKGLCCSWNSRDMVFLFCRVSRATEPIVDGKVCGFPLTDDQYLQQPGRPVV